MKGTEWADIVSELTPEPNDLVLPKTTYSGFQSSDLDAELKAWDEIIPTLEKDKYMKKVLDSQREWVDRVVFYELMNSPDYALAYNHYFPGKLKL